MQFSFTVIKIKNYAAVVCRAFHGYSLAGAGCAFVEQDGWLMAMRRARLAAIKEHRLRGRCVFTTDRLRWWKTFDI